MAFPRHGYHAWIIGIQDRNAATAQATEDQCFLFRGVFESREIVGVGAGYRKDDRYVRTDQPRASSDPTGRVRACLKYDESMPRPHSQQISRDVLGAVRRIDGGDHLSRHFAENRGQHVFRRGFSDAAGDGDELRAKEQPAPAKRGQKHHAVSQKV